MYCSNCGKKQPNPDGTYCYNCGVKLAGGQEAASERPKPVRKQLALSQKGEEIRLGLIKEGVGAALFVGGVKALLASLSLFGISLLGASPWSFIDAGLFLLLAYGIYRGNKYASVTVFTLYILEEVYAVAVTSQSGSGSGIGLVGIVVFIILIRSFYRGMKGTLAYTEGYSFASNSGETLTPLTWLTAACVVVAIIGAVAAYSVTFPNG